MKRILVSGACGFIGANLVRRLRNDGHELHIILRPGTDPWRIADILKTVHSQSCDLRNSSDLDTIVGSIKPEWIFHCASFGAYSWQTDPRSIFEINLIGSVNLLNACLETDFERFVYTGSSSEYGYCDHPPDENEIPQPNSDYACAKAAISQFYHSVAQQRKRQIIGLRLYSAYGPFEDPQRFIPTLIVHALKGRFPQLVGPTIARDFVYIEDIVAALVLAATKPHSEFGSIYNVGTGRQTTIADAVVLAQKIFSIPGQPVYGNMPDRRWDTDVWCCNNAKIGAELGWQAHFDLAAGIEATAEWLKSHLDYHGKYR